MAAIKLYRGGDVSDIVRVVIDDTDLVVINVRDSI